jgi:4-hydroxy-tetrahydrodipicolinate synthase
VDLLPETVRELASHPRIVALKEAVGSRERNQELLAFCNDEFFLLSGDDPSCLDVMEMGARGVISIAANVVPGRLRELCAAASKGDFNRARQINAELQELFEILSLESNPIPVKWALHEMSMCGPGLRLPLVELNLQHRSALRRSLAKLAALPASTNES